jgi:hypothetical protein
MTKITGTLLEDHCILMKISLSFLLRMANITDKIVQGNRKRWTGFEITIT